MTVTEIDSRNSRRNTGSRRGDGHTNTPPVDGQPAHNPEAERIVLGALILDPNLIEQTSRTLNPADFYSTTHAIIYKAILDLHAHGEPAQPIPLARHLADTGDLQRAGGAPYLHTLISAVPTTANTGYYARLVQQDAQLRTVETVGTRIATAARAADHANLDQLLTWATEQLDHTRAATQPAEPTIDTWSPVDLTPALTGGVLTPPPALLARTDGNFLLYPSRLHSISGEPESGKTWFALEAAHQALTDRQHVIYLDFEDTPEGITGRLLAMGAHPDNIRTFLHYIRPDRPIDAAARTHLTALIADQFTTIAVIDGVTEAMTLHGLDPYNNPDAAKFYEQLPRFITRQPRAPAVLLIDHVPKDEDRPKRYAIGAQHKLAGLDGAAYVVDIVKPFAPGQSGFSRVRVAKDRPGGVRRNAVGGVVAELHMSGHGDVVTLELRAPAGRPGGDNDSAGGWRPTILMERTSRYAEISPGLTANALIKGAKGRREHVLHGIELLIAEGYLRTQSGANRAVFHYSVKPFRNDEDADEAADE